MSLPKFNLEIRYQLSHIKLNGHKSIELVEINIEPGLNILIGRNGAGKSNFFEFLKMVNRSLTALDSSLTFKNAELTFRGDDATELKYSIYKLSQKQINEDNPIVPYRQVLTLNDEIFFDTTDEILSTLQVNSKRKIIPRNISGVFTRLRIRFPRTLNIGFGFPEKILGLSEPVTINLPFDFEEIWNLGVSNDALLNSAFDLLEEYLEEAFQEVDDEEELDKQYHDILFSLDTTKLIQIAELDQTALENLRKFSPIQDVRINKNLSFYHSDSHFVIDNIRLDFLVNDNWMPWSQLSDGTKRLFLIISEVSLTRNRLILIEEPELGVHPHQFDLVMQFLREQSESNQIIISTHSPKALDILEESQLENILIASYIKGEGTKIGHLNDYQKKKAIGYMNDVGFLSDYWLISDLES